MSAKTKQAGEEWEAIRETLCLGAVVDVPRMLIERSQLAEWTRRLKRAEQDRAALSIRLAAAERERDEAIRQATVLHQSLVTATAEREAAQAEGVRHAARSIEARAVALWLLQEWTDPAGWSDVIAAAEATFGMLDWLREGQG